MKLNLKHWSAVIFAAISSASIALAASSGTQSQTVPGAIFATDTNAGANVVTIVPGAAAVVDDHVIPMDDLVVMCLHKERSFVVDQMIQSYVLDRECEKRGITVSDAEIDQRVAELRTSLAPTTLEDTLKLHHMSMEQCRYAFKQSLEKPKLAADQIKSVRMVHCQEILIGYGEAGEGGVVVKTNRTEAQALAAIKDIQAELQQGKNFEDLAVQLNESTPAEKKGDMGVLFENMLGVEATALTAAIELKKDDVSQPVKTSEGYCLIRAVSTAGDHLKSEETLYAEADKASRHLQLMFLAPQAVVGLVDKSHITFAKDDEIVAGKPLPTAAAVVDDHVIPMQEVVEKCLAESGPRTIDILVQNYVVDRECERLGVNVSEEEIDRRITKLREQMAPHTLDEGLALHHTTMAGLRYDFRQEIERTKLVAARVQSTKMAHARVIFVPVNPSDDFGAAHADAAARSLMAQVQAQIKAGKNFEELAKENPAEQGREGDLGILYEGKQGMDTAILNSALAMKRGEVSSEPGKTRDGYFLLQIISTSDQHGVDEESNYANASKEYREAKAQTLVPEAIVGLLKKSKVVYYVHS
ncbi:MAG TPA: peptidylprolyl isomerase [Verrucomicrobiae bacterium]|jgi:foldase protein PrsA|nr:peptidylprolyl isomerase [Verrucomicrobiae bacterium]